MCLDSTGYLYVVDGGNDRIKVMTPDGVVVRTWGNPPGDQSHPWSLTGPTAIAADAYGHIFVAEWIISNPLVQSGVQEFTTTGEFVTAVGAYSSGGAPGTFFDPFGITIGHDGQLYVSDTGLARVQVLANDGTFVNQWSDECFGLAVDGAGNVYAAEQYNIRKTTASGVELARWGGGIGNGPGQLASPSALTLDAVGRIYVADTYNHRVQVFSPDGTLLMMWGTFGSGPGQMNNPAGIVVGPDGRVYVADTRNNRIQVFGSLPTPTQSSSWGSVKTRFR
jgi:sugar lactone lactonase YvrE